MHCTEPTYCVAISHQLQGEAALKTWVEETGRKRASPSTGPRTKIHPEKQKFSKAPPGKCLSLLSFFSVPKSGLKGRFRYRWITGYGFEPERELSEVAGRQQNSGTLISSLFCRRKKILDGFPLWILGFFSLMSKSSGVSVLPSFMVCNLSESST